MSVEIQQAVEEARLRHGKFVFVPAGASPEMREALTAFAAESGRQVMDRHVTSHGQRVAGEAAARDVPVVTAGDDAAFLAKLREIAAGRVKVV